MLPSPDVLQQRIAVDVLRPSTLETLDCDQILDERDADAAFEQAWSAARRQLLGASGASGKTTEAIRRAAFMAVSTATHQHELASYVSDDFELIALASMLKVELPFVSQLWQCYERGVIPTSASMMP